MADSSEYYVVKYVANEEQDLVTGVDLLSHSTAALVVYTARLSPGRVFMGPVNKSSKGTLNSMIAIGVDPRSGIDVLVGKIDVSALFEHMKENSLFSGVEFRLAEHAPEATDDSKLKPVFGALEPNPAPNIQLPSGRQAAWPDGTITGTSGPNIRVDRRRGWS